MNSLNRQQINFWSNKIRQLEEALNEKIKSNNKKIDKITHECSEEEMKIRNQILQYREKIRQLGG